MSKQQPLSSAERSARYRKNQIKKMGSKEYKAHRAKQARDRRAKAKLALNESPSENQLVQDLITMVKNIKIDGSVSPAIKTQLAKKAIADAKLKIQEFKSNSSCSDVKSKFIEISKKSSQPITAGTTKQYFDKMKTLYKGMFGKPWDCKELEWTRDTDGVLNYILNRWPVPGTQKGYTIALTGILKRFEGFEREYKIYSDVSVASQKANMKIKKQNKLTPAEAKRILRWEKLESIRAQKMNVPKIQQILFTLMQQVPRRAGTYRILQYRTQDTTEGNYLIYRGGNLWVVFNKYKSSALKKHGEREYELGGILTPMIRNYVRKRGMKDGDYFFTRKVKPQSEGNFSTYLSDTSGKVLGKTHRMGSRDWRISRASYIVRQPIDDMNTTQKEYEAIKMGHDYKTTQTYARAGL